MRHVAALCTAASALSFTPGIAQAQAGPPLTAVPMSPRLPPKAGVIIPDVERPADALQIPALTQAAPLRNAVIVQNANPLAAIQRLPVQRALSGAEVAATRSLKLGNATLDLTPVLANPEALPNVARRLQALPGVTVKATDISAYVVPQGLIVRSFLNYEIRPGSCTNVTLRRAIEDAGGSCAERLSESQKLAGYSDPGSARFVADPAKRATAMAKARVEWAKQEAETKARVADFRTILSNPGEREKLVAAVGAAEVARLQGLNDEALAGELINAAETKIEDVMFIPEGDAVDDTSRNMSPDWRRKLDIPIAIKSSRETLADQIYLTGFTLGRQYEWSKRIEKTIKWCWVGCAVTYYAGARAAFSYGFGLRFPVLVGGTYRYQETSPDDRNATLALTMRPINGTPAQYLASGLSSSQLFAGQEFVAELKASAGYEYKLPIIGEDRRNVDLFNYDLAAMLPAPFTNGQFEPPAPGGPGPQIEFPFRSIDLLMGYGNWGAAGVKAHPLVKFELTSDKLRFKLHDAVAKRDIIAENGTRATLAIDREKGETRFALSDPVYNLAFTVTPGVEAHAFIDVGVWSDNWFFPIWFPQIAITLPPGGIDFSCHAETVCSRSFVYAAGEAKPKIVVTPATSVGGMERPQIDSAATQINADPNAATAIPSAAAEPKPQVPQDVKVPPKVIQPIPLPVPPRPPRRP